VPAGIIKAVEVKDYHLEKLQGQIVSSLLKGFFSYHAREKTELSHHHSLYILVLVI